MKFILLFLLSTSIMTAQISTDRPTATESSKIIVPGKFQIESGIQFNYLDDKYTNSYLPSTTLRYGLSESFELRMNSQYVRSTTSGFSNFQIGTSIQILQNVALIVSAILPLDNEFSSNKLGYYQKLAASFDLSEDHFIGCSSGITGDFQTNPIVLASVLYGYSYSKSSTTMLEVYASYDDILDSYCDVAYSYLIYDNLQVDFIVGSGLNVNKLFYSFGLGWSI